MIDPLETIIKWLTGALTLTGGRVANRHRFNASWTIGQTALTVELDDGAVDLYSQVSIPRLELRLYGADRPAIMALRNELVGLSRSSGRVPVSGTSGGIALVQYFNQASGLSFIHDDDLAMDVGILFFESMISEEAVT